MNARQFNKVYPVGSRFSYHPDPQLMKPVVKTVAEAKGFKCGVIVEINVEPYFVKVETLKPLS